MLQDSRCGSRGLEKQIDADREVRAIQETSLGLFDPLAHPFQVAVPAGGSYHHVLARADASLNISENSLGRGEINYRIDPGECAGGECRCAGIVRRAQQCDVMAALARHLRDQRAGLAAA